MTNLGYGFYPTHPGEVLKDELEARGISQRKFADSIGMGYSVLNEILNGHRSLSTTSALIFEAALDIPADSLMRLQLKYDMQTARMDKTLANRLKKIARTAAIL
jgi:addiction module HigA family antidote|nr:HigA family addiction module antitoxin [uncultured Prevotella sp.]